MTHREVIGYLAGEYDKSSRSIRILAAYPGQSISNDSNSFQEAEMDPVFEVDLRAQIEKDGLQIVGWYHSHPTFQPIPSAVDVNNQWNYQHLFKGNARESSPFVGLIVSPYNLALPTTEAEFKWFYVEGSSAQPLPMAVDASHEVLTTPKDIEDDHLRTKAKSVLSMYADKFLSVRVGFSDIWREMGNMRCTNMDKIQGSIRSRLEAASAAKAASAENKKPILEKVENFLKWLRRQCIAAVDIAPSPTDSPSKQASAVISLQ